MATAGDGRAAVFGASGGIRGALVEALAARSPLSAPFQRGVPVAQLVTSQDSARHLLAVIDALEPAQSGGFFGWDGAPIPY